MSIKNPFAASLFTVLSGLLLFLLPYERLPSFEIHGLTIRLSSLVILAFIILGIPLLIKRRELFQMSKIDWAIVGYYLIALLSVTVATDHKRALLVMALWGFVLCGYLLISRTFRKNFRFNMLCNLVIWTGLITGMFGIYQFVGDSFFGLSTHYSGLGYYYTRVILGFARVQSVGLEPLYFGNFLFLPIFLSISRIAGATRKAPRIFEMIALFVMFVALVLTVSRGAYLGVAAGFLWIVICMLRAESMRKYAGVVVGVLALGFAASQISLYKVPAQLPHTGTKVAVKATPKPSGSQAEETFTKHALGSAETRDASVGPRLESIKDAFKIFKKHPILGVGIGNYGVVTTLGHKSVSNEYPIVNNQYLETLAETGILGMLGFAAVGITVLYKLIRGLIANKNPYITAALGATFLGIVVQYNFFSTIYILFVWVVIALIDAMPLQKEGSWQ